MLKQVSKFPEPKDTLDMYWQNGLLNSTDSFDSWRRS
jgi:hypothetical protein